MTKQIRSTALAVGFFLTMGSAAAQTTVTQSTISPSQADTVRAVRHLFQRHRTGGWIWTGIGGAFALRIVSVAASSGATDGFSSSPSGTLVGVAVLGGIPGAVGVGKLTRFSKAKEEQTISLYEQSNTLPPYVRKRLKRKHFAR
ncbi:hypothetical protein H8B13_08560 [Hymenobacter sp. BT188]|uniref:hypothetical protein n=1 Tax=Hymenobacter sp. BT188 TaxID=2763504 RepID=UPI0016511A57|nr:hypothetical protein [Hymenobacter sp. BT188]MBC6606868.1 hypothetical protein [Hymenobacter sp. BT188]